MKNYYVIILHETRKLMALMCLLLPAFSAVYTQSGTISTTFIALADTANLSDTSTVTVVVKNIDSVPYSGFINVYYSTDTIAFTPILFCTIGSVSLNPNDSVSTNCVINFDSTFFNAGNNIVVVWSSGNAKLAADTLWDSVYLNSSTTGIYENGPDLTFSISPCPVKDILNITLDASAVYGEIPEVVIIRDLLGKVKQTVSFGNLPHLKVDVRNLPSGLYFAELLYGDHKKSIQKFVKTE